MAERVIALIENEKGKLSISQRDFAEKIHLAQPTLNRLLKKREGVGVDVLLAVRAYLAEVGRPSTIDQILGLQSASSVHETHEGAVRSMDALVLRLVDLEKAVQGLQTQGAVKAAQKKQALIAIEKTKMGAAGNRDARLPVAQKPGRKSA